MMDYDRDQPHGLGMEEQGEQPREEDIERMAANGEQPEEVMAEPVVPEMEAIEEDWDDVSEASVESFPASDAPGWSRGS